MDHRSAGFWRSNGQCARPAALTARGRGRRGNALVAEAAFPKAAVEAAFRRPQWQIKLRKMLEKEANAGTTGDFDFDMSDSTAMATSAINLHDSKKALVAAISANPQSLQKKQACL